MDWALAISRNRSQIRVIVLALLSLAGLAAPSQGCGAEAGRGPVWSRALRAGAFPQRLSPRVIALIMRVLRPAESALRRLIVIAAFGLKPLQQVPSSGKPGGWPFLTPAERGGEVDRAKPETVRGALRAFRLFDPLKSFGADSLRDVGPVWDSGFEFPHAAIETLDQPVEATRLGKRLHALIRALDNIPRQARRLLRHTVRRDERLNAGLPARLSPIRPGLPPGWRERRIHEIDDVLKECHRLAIDRLNGP